MTLEDLNHDVYGGAESYPKSGESSVTEHTTEAPSDAPRETQPSRRYQAQP